MNNPGSGFGLMCSTCGSTFDIIGTIGADPQRCPQCGGIMVPNPNAKITAKVTCKKCNSSFGLINSDKCPKCGEPFA
jgi:rRNA maturation endonuclease Nob1